MKGVRSQLEMKEERKVEMKEEKVDNEEVARVKEEKNEGEHKIGGVKVEG